MVNWLHRLKWEDGGLGRTSRRGGIDRLIGAVFTWVENFSSWSTYVYCPQESTPLPHGIIEHYAYQTRSSGSTSHTTPITLNLASRAAGV